MEQKRQNPNPSQKTAKNLQKEKKKKKEKRKRDLILLDLQIQNQREVTDALWSRSQIDLEKYSQEIDRLIYELGCAPDSDLSTF